MALGFGRPRLRNQDFLTDRITVVLYPPGAGGKFLSACLGLSRHAILNDDASIVDQCQGNFSQKQKFELLKSRLLVVGDMWSDMGLAFPAPQDHFCKYPIELKRYYDIPDHLPRVLESGLRLFSEIAFSNRMDWEYRVWPNTRVIGFTNAFEFIRTHRPRRFHPEHWRYSHDLVETYRAMRQDHWPEGPPVSQQELDHDVWNRLLNLEQKNQLLELTYDQDFIDTWYRLEQANIVTQTQRAQHHRFWDAFAYTDIDYFLIELKKLYDWFEFDDFNQEYLAELHILWSEKSRDK